MTETTQETQEAQATEEAKANAPRIVEVANPTKEEMAALKERIGENFDFNVEVKPVTFNFKKSVDKDTGIETIRKPVDLAIPYPSMDGIIAILEAGGKGVELLRDAIETIVNQQARELLYDDLKLTAATFPVDKLSWEYIANIPKVARRGGGIPKEVWEAFALDYIAVMPEVTGKEVDQVTRMSKILTGKLAAVRTNEPVLNLVIEQLTVYADSSENISDFAECIEFLINKAETFLNVEPEDLLANL